MNQMSIDRDPIPATETPVIGENDQPFAAAPEEGDARTRGNLRRRVLIGTGFAGFAAALLGAAPAAKAQNGAAADADHAGPLSSATISFGSWMTTPSLDRFPNLNPRQGNHHHLCPGHVTIRSGGCVNFVIAGFHLVLVYDDGTQPGEINANLLIKPTNQPLPLLIADPNRRIYRGLDPSLVPQDRVEVVHFDRPGTYLVICGSRPHFLEGMYGFITVLP